MILSSQRPIAHFQVLLLGPFELYRDGVAIPTERWQRWVDSLLKLVVTSPNRRRLKEEIVDALWPNVSAQAGSSDLRYVLHLLRRNLGGGEPSPILSDRMWIALNPAYAWEIDLEQFETLIASQATSARERAAPLYRGEPLIENRYEDWSARVRSRLQAEWRDLCLSLGRQYRASSPESALRWLDRVLEADPLDEETLRESLALLAHSGRRAEAARRYARYATTLQLEIGAEPSPELQGLATQMFERPPGAVPPDGAEHVPAIAAPVKPASLPSASTAFVGRNGMVYDVVDQIALATGPRGVLLTGDGGMGKTRFLVELAVRAREHGELTLAGTCYEQEDRLPYSPFRDALLDYLRMQPAARIEADLAGLTGQIVRIVPELRGWLNCLEAPATEDVETARLQLFAAVARLLARISRDRPTVLMIDDLQWADEGTVQLLHFLLRQALPNLLLIAAFRPDEVPGTSALGRILGDIRASRSPIERIILMPLDPLGPADLEELLSGQLNGRCGPELAETIGTASEGNPFFALQMLALLAEERRIVAYDRVWHLSDAGAVGLPGAVRDVIARRLGRLSDLEQEALSFASIWGRELRFSPLASLWQGEDDELFRALETALSGGLLRETETGYAFAQPLLHEVVYNGIPIHRRRRLHGRAARNLQVLYGTADAEHAAEIAWHFLRSDETTQALPYLLIAGTRAEASFAQYDAERHYRAALELARACGDEESLSEALLRLGHVVRMTDRPEEALRLLREAANRYAARGDALAEARALSDIVKTVVRTGGQEDVTDDLERVRTILGGLEHTEPTPELVRLYDDLGNVYFRTGRYEELIAIRERGVEAARVLGETSLLVRAETGRATALGMLGHLQEAGRLALGLLPSAEASGDLPAIRVALATAAEACMVSGEFDRSGEYRERELQVARRMAQTGIAGATLSNLAQLALYRGEWDAACSLAHEAIEVLEGVGSASRAVYPRAFLAQIRLYRGDQHAIEVLEEHACLAARLGDVQAARYVQRILAQHDVEAGKPRTAIQRLGPLLDRSGREETDVTALLPILAWACVRAAGNEQEMRCARAAVRNAQSRARRQQHNLALLDALLVSACIYASGQLQDAERALSEAVSLAAAMPYPYAEARARHSWGMLLLGADARRNEGERLIEEAAKTFRCLNSAPNGVDVSLVALHG